MGVAKGVGGALATRIKVAALNIHSLELNSYVKGTYYRNLLKRVYIQSVLMAMTLFLSLRPVQTLPYGLKILTFSLPQSNFSFIEVKP